MLIIFACIHIAQTGAASYDIVSVIHVDALLMFTHARSVLRSQNLASIESRAHVESGCATQ